MEHLCDADEIEKLVRANRFEVQVKLRDAISLSKHERLLLIVPRRIGTTSTLARVALISPPPANLRVFDIQESPALKPTKEQLADLSLRIIVVTNRERVLEKEWSTFFELDLTPACVLTVQRRVKVFQIAKQPMPHPWEFMQYKIAEALAGAGIYGKHNRLDIRVAHLPGSTQAILEIVAAVMKMPIPNLHLYGGNCVTDEHKPGELLLADKSQRIVVLHPDVFEDSWKDINMCDFTVWHLGFGNEPERRFMKPLHRTFGVHNSLEHLLDEALAGRGPYGEVEKLHVLLPEGCEAEQVAVCCLNPYTWCPLDKMHIIYAGYLVTGSTDLTAQEILCQPGHRVIAFYCGPEYLDNNLHLNFRNFKTWDLSKIPYPKGDQTSVIKLTRKLLDNVIDMRT